MKEKFIKFSRILIGASFFALLLLIGVVFGESEGVTNLPDMVFSVVALLCLFVIFCACICVVIAFFLSVIEWIKKDKLELLKRFVSYFLIVGVILVIVKLTGKTENLDILGLVVATLRTVPIFFAVDYIFINKKDEA